MSYRRDLRRTIADFSQGRLPSYTLDTFSTPEGTLGIRLESKVRKGITKEYTDQSTNIYWFCRHLEESGYLVKECYIGHAPELDVKASQSKPSNQLFNNPGTMFQDYVWTYGPENQDHKSFAYIVVRKVDETDVEETKRKKK